MVRLSVLGDHLDGAHDVHVQLRQVIGGIQHSRMVRTADLVAT
jgi:hypothetical protein